MQKRILFMHGRWKISYSDDVSDFVDDAILTL